MFHWVLRVRISRGLETFLIGLCGVPGTSLSGPQSARCGDVVCS